MKMMRNSGRNCAVPGGISQLNKVSSASTMLADATECQNHKVFCFVFKLHKISVKFQKCAGEKMN